MSSPLSIYREAFRGLSREVWIVSLALFVNRCGTMVLTFLVLYLTSQQGYSESEAGVVLAVYGLGSIAGVAAGGWLVDRVGFRAVLVGSLAAGGLGFIGFGFVGPGPGMLVAAAVVGFLVESFRPANAAAVASFCRPHERARAYGLNRLALNLGWTIGPALGGLLAAVDYQWLFWVDGATCIASALLLAVALPAADPPRAQENVERATAPRSPWRDGFFLMVFGLLVVQGLVFFQVMSTYPLYLHDVRGYSTRLVGLVLVVNGALVVLVEMPLIKRLETGNALALCGFATLLIGLGFGLLPLSGALSWVVLLMVVWTFGEMLVAPMMTAWVANRAPDESRGAYMAAFTIAFSLCSAGAPYLGTLVYERAGPNTLWWGCFGVCCLAFLAFLALSRRER